MPNNLKSFEIPEKLALMLVGINVGINALLTLNKYWLSANASKATLNCLTKLFAL